MTLAVPYNQIEATASLPQSNIHSSPQASSASLSPNPLRQLLLTLNHAEISKGSSIRLIGLDTISENINSDRTFLVKLEQLFDSRQPTKSSTSSRAKKQLSEEERAAQKKEAIYNWAADEWLRYLKEEKKLARQTQATNRAATKNLRTPADNARSTRIPPKHLPLIAKAAELSKYCSELDNLPLEWNHQAPDESFSKFSKLRLNIVSASVDLVRICSPFSRLRVGGESPTAIEVKRVQRLLKHACTIIEDVTEQLSPLVDTAILRIQKTKLAAWKDSFNTTLGTSSWERQRLERWGIGGSDINTITDALSKETLSPTDLRKGIIRGLERLYKRNVSNHFARRNADRALPKTWESWEYQERESYLKAELGWRFYGLANVWTTLAAKHQELQSTDPIIRQTFIFHFALRLTSMDVRQVVKAALADPKKNEVVDPYLTLTSSTWQEFVGNMIGITYDRPFFTKLTDLVIEKLRVEGRDQLPHRYAQAAMSKQEQEAAVTRFILNEFTTFDKILLETLPPYTDPRITSLHQRLEDVQKAGHSSANMIKTLTSNSATTETAPSAPASRIHPAAAEKNDITSVRGARWVFAREMALKAASWATGLVAIFK